MEYSIGQQASFSKTITESDVSLFAEISGDFNPVHVNEPAAENSPFKERVVHGALTASLISTVLGNRLPGEGTIYLEQNSRFIKPVKIGDTLTARAEITEINNGKAVLKTTVINQRDEIVLDGSAKVKLPLVQEEI